MILPQNREEIYYNAWALILDGDIQGLIRLAKFGSFADSWKDFEHALSNLHNDGMSAERIKQLREKQRQINPEKSFEVLQKSGINILLQTSPLFPNVLKELAVSPPGIFVQESADKSLLTSAAGDGQALGNMLIIAFVGTRRATQYGKEATIKLIQGLSQLLTPESLIIVSGLAFGIDAQAHKAALANGLKTWAVIPSGLDNIYPTSHTQLAKEIVAKGGAIISENPFGTAPEPYRFLQRNRIISGLAVATVVVEAPEKSGALITARYALEQNREVMAVPGSIFGNQSKGTNELIRKGAAPVTSGRDILESLGIEVSLKEQVQKLDNLSDNEKKILDYIFNNSSTSLDEIIQECGLSASEASISLMELELKGLVKGRGGQYFAN